MKRRLRLATLIAALLWSAGCGDNPAGNGTPCNHVDVDGLVVTRGTAVIANQWQGAVLGEIHVPPDSTAADLLVTWVNADSTALVFNPGCDVNFDLRWTLANSGIAEITPGSSKWRFNVRALARGTTTVRLRLFHDDHPDFSSLEIPIRVAVVKAATRG